MPDPDISVVIPLRDEEENVVPLHRELADVLDQLGVSYEVILVDDGSTDGTFEQLAMVQAQDPTVKAVRFTRNFGQTAAFAAGFSAARGQYIVTLDGDLQNDPRDIPGMLALARRKDIVSGWRRKRQDSFVTRHLPSAIANWLLGIITGVRLHDNGCSLKVYRANVVKPLKLRPGMHRYLPAIASQLGGRVAEVEVHHRPRRHGRSKYNLSRTFRVVADLVQLRRLMREAVDPNTPAPHLYDIAEVRQAGP
ncbi:MAG TPA: glycosyltransferase family 2 protein [Vicinamibacterales bacterium]|nr:glycosyltransferase family 2 protein [Vicinamibacterales bacterium]